jgi:FkbM family methyltransferase
MLTKIKTAFRVFFPKTEIAKVKFENDLNNNSLIEKFDVNQGLYTILLSNNSTLHIRNEAHSDYKVFCQILNNEEYQLIISILKHQSTLKGLNIIDAGANIGLTTYYFSQFIDSSKIFCIEPSDSNLAVLEKNIEEISNNEVNIYPNALSHESNLFFDIENDFRDGLDWASTTKLTKNGKIKGITLAEIIEQNKLECIDFLKIDIEGAERFIFSLSSNLKFLLKTKIIAIEIHDEFETRMQINSILISNNFIIFESGELTIGINKLNLK